MNDNKSLKRKAITGAIWKFSERIASRAVSFVVSVILARLLLPEDYGIIALVGVFITICDKLVISGFATSLIQKKDADNLDFSTVFFFSLGMSLMLYTALFLSAPLIADFYSAYDRELLINVIRVMGIQIIATAVNSVQHAYVSRTMQFKKNMWSALGGTTLSAIVGVTMAYKGYGVWALVAQYCVDVVAVMIILWIVVRWRPQLKFSVSRFKALFAYGWKIFAASMIKVLYNDLRSLVIGKFYSAADLAYYNKGQSFPQLVESNVGGTIESVLFPTISKRQSSKEDMLLILRRAIKTSTYILSPILAGLAAVAAPLIEILLTEKWLPSTVYMQILCFTFMLMPVEMDNLQAIKAMGRSDIALKLEIIKKIIGITLLAVSIPFGVKAIAITMLIGAVANAIIDAIPNQKLLGYNFVQQVKDTAPSFVMSLIMFAVVYPISFVKMNVYLLLVIQVTVGVIIYFGLSVIFKTESFLYLVDLLKGILKKKGVKNEP